MTDRERLIELIREAKKHTKNAKSDLERNMIFADYILSDGWIRPPCKVGDTVYFVYCDNIYPHKIKHFEMTEYGNFAFSSLMFTFKQFGKDVFLTREEAEKELAERQGKNEKP